MAFDTNVFVNCPFDDRYLPLLRPLLFCVIFLQLEPRIALERNDSGEPRVDKIISLLKDSKFGIHDISRLKAEKKGEYFRLNMPFELGVDVGCKLFKPGKWTGKRILILETEKYRYQAAISDLSNSDIAVHGDDPAQLVYEVRNWLNTAAGLHAPGPSFVWSRFNDFMADNYKALALRGFSDEDIERLPADELMECMKEWVAKHLE